MIHGLVLVAALAAGAGDELAGLAAAGAWDDIVARAGERLEADPVDHEASFWLGRAWIVRGEELLAGSPGRFARDLAHSNLTRAVDALGSVAAGHARATESRDWRAYARLLRGDEELGADMERWWEAERHGYAAYVRGLVAERAGEPDAVAWLERAVEAGEARLEVLVAWTDALGRAGRVPEGLEAWERTRRAGAAPHTLAASLVALLPAAAQAEERLRRLRSLDVDPTDALMAWYRAHALDALGRTEAAAMEMAAATAGRTAEVDRFHAHLLIRLERHGDALALLAPRVAEGDADAAGMVLDLADWLGLAQRWDDAVGAYDLVLEHRRRDERAARNRALTLSRAGREDEAFAAWDRLVELYERRADVLNDAALMREGAGRHEEARALWERAIALGQPGAAAENLAAHLLATDPGRALVLLEEVVDTDPTRDRALYLRKQARRAHLR